MKKPKKKNTKTKSSLHLHPRSKHLNAPVGECMHPLEGELRIRYENRPVKVLHPALCRWAMCPEDIRHCGKLYYKSGCLCFAGNQGQDLCGECGVSRQNCHYCCPPLYNLFDSVDWFGKWFFGRHAASLAVNNCFDPSKPCCGWWRNDFS